MDVPRMYGDKSTAHRLHLELCGAGAYARIFSEMVLAAIWMINLTYLVVAQMQRKENVREGFDRRLQNSTKMSSHHRSIK